MAIILNDNINLTSSKPLDKRYGPYADVSAALSALPAFQRFQGLTVGIIVEGAVVDYWFNEGIEDVNLILKTSAGTGTGTGDGYTGSRGDVGFVGSQGDIGYSGSVGYTGSEGSGFVGSQGDIGYTGSIGYSGSVGYSGSQLGFETAQDVKTVTSGTYTLQLSDAGYLIRFDNSSGVILTVPNDIGANFEIGQRIDIEQAGTGAVVLDTGVGVLLQSSGFAGLNSQHSVGSLVKLAGNQWLFVGPSGYTGSAGEGYTGSQGYAGSVGPAGQSVQITGSAATAAQLPTPYGGNIGDGYITQDDGHLHVWDGAQWNDVGQLVGYTGSIGYSGSAGYSGSVGYTGSIGIGYAGSSGYTGSQGLEGYTGSEGDIGYTGSQGLEGFVGSQGELGYTGSIGYSGSGYTGSVGFVGSLGYSGSVGYTGSDGESSFTWGSDPPENPRIGDRWYDTIKGALVVFLDDGDSTQWVEVTASGFIGAKGYTGSEGDVGYAGSTGYTGSRGAFDAVGFTGSAGLDGYTGSQGDVGFVGSQGDTGFVGSQGDTGFVGSQGDTGFVGSQGDTGFVGSEGYTGSIGYTGSQGDTGFVGSQGDTGFVGSQGDVGFVGSEGIDGTDGTDGYTGSKGDIGDLNDISGISENYQTISGATGTVDHDTSTSNNFLHVSPAADWTANFTNVSTTDDRTRVISIIVIQGGTAYVPTNVTIDGQSVNIYWSNGVLPASTPSGVDLISFNLVRDGTNWYVLGQSGSYFIP